MKTENFKKISTIVVCVVLGVAFLVDTLIKRLLLRYLYVHPIELYSLVFCSAILICLLFISRKYFGIANFFKAFSILVIFWFVDSMAAIMFSYLVSELIYQLVRPWLVTALILLLFLWIAKCRIAKDKNIFTLIGIAYLLNVILNILEYLRLLGVTNRITVNNFFGYLELLNGGNSIEEFVAVLAFYAQILLVFLLLIKSLSLYGKEPIKKTIEMDDSDETDSLVAVDGETWKCMGCGRLVPINDERCSCGYKK